MRKVCIISLAVVVSMAFVPTAPAQVPAEVHQLICDLDVESVVPIGTGAVSGTHTATSAYSSPGSAPGVDVYGFCGAEGDAIDFFIDNVDTPSDLWACVTATPSDPCDPPFYNAIITDLGGDDELGCSVPHPFACPAGQAPLPADNGDGVYFLRIGTWSNAGGYDGTLTVNGNNPLLVLQ